MSNNSWEEAFNTMPQNNDPIKQRQREIKQDEWTSDLPNINKEPLVDALEIRKIDELLKDFKQTNEPLHKTVERLINIYSRLVIQNKKVQQAMTIL